MLEGKRLLQLYKKLREAEKRYENKFGKGSLENTIYCDPLFMDDEEYYLEVIERVNRAVERNKPFKQYSEEELKKMIF